MTAAKVWGYLLCLFGLLSTTAVQAAAINGSCPIKSNATTSSVASATSHWSAPPYVEPTGTPVKKRLTITWEDAAPNGVHRPVIKINGQFPGPELVFDEDDQVEVCENW